MLLIISETPNSEKLRSVDYLVFPSHPHPFNLFQNVPREISCIMSPHLLLHINQYCSLRNNTPPFILRQDHYVDCGRALYFSTLCFHF